MTFQTRTIEKRPISIFDVEAERPPTIAKVRAEKPGRFAQWDQDFLVDEWKDLCRD